MRAAVRWAAVPAVMALLAGCAAQAPVQVPTARTAVAAASCPREAVDPASGEATYRSLDATALIGLVGPPPEAGSEAQQRDLEAVLAAQRAARDTPRRALAIADADDSCVRFADALGGELPAAQLPFLDRVAWQAAGVTGAAKRHYRRARPYVGHAEVERLADIAVAPAPGAADARDYSSYPSGHAAFGAACAILLADMVPERAGALFERARSYAESREIVGAHYPRDVEAGRLAGALAMAAIRQDPCFRADEAPVRSAVRAALGLAH